MISEHVDAFSNRFQIRFIKGQASYCPGYQRLSEDKLPIMAYSSAMMPASCITHQF